tara:strand:+ start:478 stop:759 length:282 start_codon:yes stop_codon:yes gene_type:complete
MRIYFASLKEERLHCACSSEKEALAEARYVTADTGKTTHVEAWDFPDRMNKKTVILMYNNEIKVVKTPLCQYVAVGRKKPGGTWRTKKVKEET